METKEIALKLNNVVSNVISQTQLQGFDRAFSTANAIKELKILLNDDYMKPIMELQGNKLGFRTDKDKSGGYPIDVVKNCLIEAVLLGVQPYGNQFNIIAGNTYLTKEGTGHILNNWQGLSYTIVCEVPEVSPGGKFAVVNAKIKWSLNGKDREEIIPISVKNDAYSTVDSLTGKATRKARAWLVSAISGIEVVEGDVSDISYVDITQQPRQSAKQVANQKSLDKVVTHIEKSKSVKELERCFTAIPKDNSDLLQDYYFRWIDLSKTEEELNTISSSINEEFYDVIIAFDEKKRELSKG